MNRSPQALRNLVGVSALLAATLAAPVTAQSRYVVSTLDRVPAMTLAAEYASLIGAARRPDYVVANNSCVERLVAGDLAAARSDCDAALAAAPDRLALRAAGRRFLADLHANRGVVRALQGEVAGAEADFRRALELDADHDDAEANLARLLGEIASL